MTAVTQGDFAVRIPLLSGLSLYVLRACETRRHPRSLCLSENAGPRRPARCAITTCRFRSTSAATSGSGNGCSWTASRSRRIRRARRSGIAARISSTASAIAPSVTARAISSAASSPVSVSRADRIRKARAGYRTSLKKALGDWSEKDIAYFLEAGQTPDGDTIGGSMGRVIRNTSQLSASRPRRDRRIPQIAARGGRPAAADEEDELDDRRQCDQHANNQPGREPVTAGAPGSRHAHDDAV